MSGITTKAAVHIWRGPLRSALAWTTGGIGTAYMLPPLLSAQSYIYSTTILATTLYGGAVAILLPLGLARGVVTYLQSELHQQDEAWQAALASTQSNVAATRTTSSDSQGGSSDYGSQSRTFDTKAFYQSITGGPGWRGQVFRTMASPILPSTAQMLVRIQKAVDQHPSSRGHNDAQVWAAAAAGFVEGYVQDKKDTMTVLGIGLYGIVVGVGLGVDYATGQAQKAKERAGTRMKQAYDRVGEDWKEKVQHKLDIAREKQKEANKKLQAAKNAMMGGFWGNSDQDLEEAQDSLDEVARQIAVAEKAVARNTPEEAPDNEAQW